ncbi:Beta-lactamase precursor [Thalassovita gelatinovora]|uniref:Beta-lactamase n=2 Tax=Thalassovita gelatinovora TaxID=53501 RepID=A0A0P1FGD2_THAGE|nr:MBL fold metallo-hydrolase [Thalassovita gelatinovora]CUH67127.1 Beta-lactamase precursor [Thalassovita gelatinovora]SEP80054.1 Glyoxylase, beta-lactamase superfamily II [Thalassovita gelatinovora]
MKIYRLFGAAFALAFASSVAQADMLEVQNVTDGVFALVGPMEQRSAANLANNATFGVVVTDEGVVLMDPGGSWKGAEAIHAQIREITDQPVRYVIDTGGQDHRWLGNGYWQAQGATVIASQAAVEDHKARGSQQLSALTQFLGDQLSGTNPAYANVTFEDSYMLELGGVTFEITHAGQAHTPGDSFVWLAAKDTVFTGDIVYVERILGNGGQSNAKSWIATFEAMAALKPTHVVPGHGHATTLEKATADTYDYLVNLRTRIGALIEDGGDIIDAPKIDQSAFSYLDQFDSLAGRNAQTTYEQMEWE